MIACPVVCSGGWYVIYQQKVMLGKQHNTSWHAALGLFAIGGYALAAAGGLSALHPDWGVAKTNQKLRLAHKLSARTFTAVAFLALATGWSKQDGILTTGALSISLAVLAWVLLLRPQPQASAYTGLPQTMVDP